MQLSPTGHTDTFTRERVLAVDPYPELVDLGYPARLNAGVALLDDVVARFGGDRPAVVTDQMTWSYADLLRRADQIAHVLTVDEGLASGGRVLVRGPNSPDFIAIVLGVWRAGGVVVASTNRLTARELTPMTDIARIELALVDHRCPVSLDRPVQMVTFGDDEWEVRLDKHPGAFTPVDTAADDVAMIQFTSGTTGQPKGALHFHRDVLAMADVVGGQAIGITSDDLVTSNRTMGFGYAFGALIAFPLRHGAAALVLDDDSPAATFEAVVRHGATVLMTSPPVYRAALAGAAGASLGRLRRATSGGEMLPAATSQAWYDRYGMRLVNLFGTTELTHAILGAVSNDTPHGSVGRPLPGYEARVLSEDGRDVPAGEAGELAILGPTGCRHLDHPRQRTAVREGWTCTGDVVHMDTDGNVWVHGRSDDLVSVDGWLVAPAEVEEVMLEYPGVGEAVVTGVPLPDGGSRLHAFLTGAPDLAGLDAHLRANVARCKVPEVIEVLDAMPRTTIGKVDRMGLRDRAAQAAAG
ncbi:MAG TPA: AMP-binding protein [Micromonosporaceae bacterium]|nr:AMP-binding protein [Micromonosporaceae bacterium]